MTDQESLTLAFVRGVTPGKWADRWRELRTRRPLTITPLDGTGDPGSEGADVTIVRVPSDAFPQGSRGEPRSRHAVFLYEEQVSLVVDIDHELADSHGVDLDDIALVRLLDHPDHDHTWPEPEAWVEEEYRPTSIEGTLELVATGLGGVLLPQPLARQLINKRKHVAIPVNADLDGTRVFASWDLSRDDDDIQELIGVLRGRTARSSRS